MTAKFCMALIGLVAGLGFGGDANAEDASRQLAILRTIQPVGTFT